MGLFASESSNSETEESEDLLLKVEAAVPLVGRWQPLITRENAFTLLML